jgi:hypothetical protein
LIRVQGQGSRPLAADTLTAIALISREHTRWGRAAGRTKCCVISENPPPHGLTQRGTVAAHESKSGRAPFPKTTEDTYTWQGSLIQRAYCTKLLEAFEVYVYYCKRANVAMNIQLVRYAKKKKNDRACKSDRFRHHTPICKHPAQKHDVCGLD